MTEASCGPAIVWFPVLFMQLQFLKQKTRSDYTLETRL